MEQAVFKKMKSKQGMSARVINPPEDYPYDASMEWKDEGTAAFVHVFVEDKDAFGKCFSEAARAAEPLGLLWVSYPKSSGKVKYDINRDSLWDLLIPQGWHPVSQVSLDEKWSAVRVKPNEEGTEYVRPNSRR